MSTIPETVSSAWDKRKGPAIFTTSDADGLPNAIYVTCVSKYNNEKILIADNYFDKTKNNIKNGSKGSILFMTEEGKAYQIKGSLEYEVTGDLFEDMMKWNPETHPGNAVAAVNAEEIYSGAEKLV